MEIQKKRGVQYVFIYCGNSVVDFR